jgi:hypothetical protein
MLAPRPVEVLVGTHRDDSVEARFVLRGDIGRPEIQSLHILGVYVGPEHLPAKLRRAIYDLADAVEWETAE